MATIPSIAMIPSGVKASKLYSVLPTDGAGDFTTTRASVATRVNENGLIEEVASNVPRLDYSDGTCPSLLLEPAARNFLIQSESFDDVAWTKDLSGVASAPVVTANQGISPDGTLNADRIVFDLNGGASSGDGSIIQQVITLTGINVNTRSVYLKSNTNLSYDIILGTNTANSSAEKITVTTEWQRFEVTQTPTTTATNFYLGLRNAFGFSGLSDSADVLVYGASLEENSYATSYIKTVGTTQTRVADSASGSGNSTVINSAEGTLYFEGSALADDGTSRRLSISDGTANNHISIDISEYTNTIIGRVRSSNIEYAFMTTTGVTQSNTNKIALKYKSNDCSLWVNGVELVTDISVTMPIGLSELSFDNGGGINNFYGKTKSVQVYTTALSDAELTALTTI